MKGKKAQLVEGVLIIIAILATTQFLFAAVSHSNTVEESISSPGKVHDFYFQQDKDDFFHEDSGRLAVSGAYSEVVAKPPVESSVSCRTESFNGKFYDVWTESCKPNNDRAKEVFLENVKKKFQEFSGKKKFTISLEGEEVKFVPVEANITEKFESEFVDYEITRPLFSSFAVSYPGFGFEEAYAKIMQQKKDCTVDFVVFGDCIGKYSLEGWSTDYTFKDEFIFFTLISEENYFYNGEFKPVELRFAIEKLSLNP